MAYQVDFLPVGEGSKSGDAIAMRFGDLSDRMKTDVVVIDGGFRSSGETLVKHIRDEYKTTYVELVVSTHPDSDHSSGLSVVLEELKVGRLWMHKPWDHTYDIAKMFQNGRVTDMSVAEGIRKSLEDVRYLERLAKQKNIPIYEPFTGLTDQTRSLTVLGPTEQFYEGLLPDFRCTPTPKYESILARLAGAPVALAVRVAETLGIETLTEPTEGTHAENNSSVIMLFQHGQDCILFTADAGVPALDQAVSQLEGVGFDFNHLRIVQVPHHGSKRNVGPKILDRILGPRLSTDEAKRRAVVSASPEGEPKHPSKRVLNAFRRRGARMQGTTTGSILMFNKDAPRLGWTSAPDLPFYSVVEED